MFKRIFSLLFCFAILNSQAQKADSSASKHGFYWNVECTAGFMQFGITPSFGVATSKYGNFSFGSGVQMLNQYPGEYVIRSMFTNRFNIVHPFFLQYDYRFTKKRVSPLIQWQSGYRDWETDRKSVV